MRWIGLVCMFAVACEYEGGEGNGGDENGGDGNGGTDTNGGGGNGGGNGGTDTNVDPSCNSANENCGPSTCGGEGGSMLPGSDCLSCHRSGGAEEAPTWYAGGTAFVDDLGSDGASGATIKVTDSTGYTATMTTNSVGNFYTSHRLVPPLTATITTSAGTQAMGSTVNTGACDSCHSCGGEAGGKLYTP